MNLFWSTRHLTSAREDHLTEFFAAALELSSPFRNRFATAVLGEYAQANGWQKPEIVLVETQTAYEGTSCRPDMRLTLADGRVLLSEHKLDALETAGPESGEPDQLKRYLALPADGLIYVRSSWKPPDRDVMAHPKYIRPEEREHFLWRDFYHMLDVEDNIFLRWLKEGFERLGFTPPHPSIGEFKGPDPELNKNNRRNFAKLWAGIRTFAHGLGWSVGPGSIVELYMWENPSALASNVFVSPVNSSRFLIRVTPKDIGLETITKAMQAAAASLVVPAEVNVSHVPRTKEKVTEKVAVVDITTSLFAILGREPQSVTEMERKLFSYVTHFLQALQR